MEEKLEVVRPKMFAAVRHLIAVVKDGLRYNTVTSAVPRIDVTALQSSPIDPRSYPSATRT
jgi:hypothetical protein